MREQRDGAAIGQHVSASLAIRRTGPRGTTATRPSPAGQPDQSEAGRVKARPLAAPRMKLPSRTSWRTRRTKRDEEGADDDPKRAPRAKQVRPGRPARRCAHRCSVRAGRGRPTPRAGPPTTGPTGGFRSTHGCPREGSTGPVTASHQPGSAFFSSSISPRSRPWRRPGAVPSATSIPSTCRGPCP